MRKRNHNTHRHTKAVNSPAMDSFTMDEQRRLMADLPDTLTGHSIRTLLGSGLLVQELLALQTEDIAEDGSWIRVARPVELVNGHPCPAKGASGARTIPIAEDFRSSAQFLRRHGGSPAGSAASFRKRYFAALRQVGGVRPLRPQSCRHTFILNLMWGGVSIGQISHIIGHSSVGTTAACLGALARSVRVLNRREAV